MSRPLRVLLWSPPGVGLHYCGPSMTAYRMYRRAEPGRFDLTLVHGQLAQDRYPLFREQVFLGDSSWGLVKQWKYVRAGRAWMERNARGFDVVHGLQGFHSTVAPCLVAERMGVPAVIKFAVHGVELAGKGGIRGMLRVAERRRAMVAQLAGVIAISSTIAEELVGYGIRPERIARIPNGVDMTLFRPARDEEERREARAALGLGDRPTLVFVGAVGERKRPHLVVDALGLLRRQGVDAQLAVVGPDEGDMAYVGALRSRVRELGLEDRIAWIGFTEDPSAIYRAGDCFVLPSRSEGLPNAMLEAMASGLPAIGTRISGIVDLVRDGETGRLVEPEAESIAAALRPWLEDLGACRAAGRRALALVARTYGVDAVLDAHERLFRAVMAGRPAAEASLLGEAAAAPVATAAPAR